MISVELNQSILNGGAKMPTALVLRTCRAVTKELKITLKVNISAGFVSERDMWRLNKEYRGKDAVTDVLSFPLDDEDVIGEGLICYSQAVRQAKQMGHGVRDELVFLLTHGILHVLHFDHETPKDAKQMFPRQERILRALNANPRL